MHHPDSDRRPIARWGRYALLLVASLFLFPVLAMTLLRPDENEMPKKEPPTDGNVPSATPLKPRASFLYRWFKRGVWATLLLTIAAIIGLLVYFPGGQTPIALTLATGIGADDLQQRVDRLEDKAIRGEPFTDEEIEFLRDLYGCLPKAARLLYVLRQSADLMDHFLGASGEDYRTAPRIFVNSRPVQYHLDGMRQAMQSDLRRGVLRERYATGWFYMGDPEFFESCTGLYDGRLIARPTVTEAGDIHIAWRAEADWDWPDYETIRRRHGQYHARCFAFPNARSWLFGDRYCVRLDDGLGAELIKLGYAKPYLAYAEWVEEIGAGEEDVEPLE